MSSTRHVGLGIQVDYAGGPYDEMRRLWQFADAVGFEWFSLSDHFRKTPARDAEGPCFEALTILAAVAAQTSKLRFGPLVAAAPFRNPGVYAKVMTTLDHVSGGRVECGVGAGWFEGETTAYGLEFLPTRERFDRLEEYVQVLRSLFDRERTDFSGKYYQLTDASNDPPPVQKRLPICIGGLGEKRTMPLAARYADAWNAPLVSPKVFVEKCALLDRLCKENGRSGADVLRTVNVAFYAGADPSSIERQEARYAQDWGGGTHGFLVDGFLRGNVADAVPLLETYVEAGADRIILSVREGPYEWSALEAFADTVIPRFGAARAIAPGGA